MEPCSIPPRSCCSTPRYTARKGCDPSHTSRDCRPLPARESVSQACLPRGLPWEQGFADGLFNSAVFVPILSKDALAPFAQLQEGSQCDNVCLEHRIALALVELGHLPRIFPILVGEAEQHATLGSLYGNFFSGGGKPDCPQVRLSDVYAQRHTTIA